MPYTVSTTKNDFCGRVKNTQKMHNQIDNYPRLRRKSFQRQTIIYSCNFKNEDSIVQIHTEFINT